MSQKVIRKETPNLAKIISWGAIVSICITIVLSAAIASIVRGEIISEKSTGYGVMILLFISSYMGAYAACRRMGKQMLTTSLLSGATYLVALLIINLLVFNGKFHGVTETTLLVLCGCTVAAMWTSRNKKEKRKLKLKN